jgi:hypothetical protein
MAHSASRYKLHRALPCNRQISSGTFCRQLPKWYPRLSTSASACVTQVFGNLFGVLATVFSIAVFRNPVSLAGLSGYSLTIVGVLLYMREKYGKGAVSPVPSDKVAQGGPNAA